MSLTYTGTTDLTFTAVTNQPLDNTTLHLEIYELTDPHSLSQQLALCTTGTTCSTAPVVPSAAQGEYIAVVTYASDQTYTAADVIASSGSVYPPAWTISLAYTVDTKIHVTATTDYDISAGPNPPNIEIFEQSRGGNNDLGWCNPTPNNDGTSNGSTTCSFDTVPDTKQSTYVAIAGTVTTFTYASYASSGQVLATSSGVTPPPWSINLTSSPTGGMVATTNYDTSSSATNSGWFIEYFDVTTNDWTKDCPGSTQCFYTPLPNEAGHQFIATVGALSNSPLPNPTFAVSNSATVGGPGAAFETAGGSNPAEDGSCYSCSGDPVNTETGEFFLNDTDINVAGRGPGLVLTRSYSSERAGQDGDFGPGWSDSYGMRLGVSSDGSVQIRQENGSQVSFTPSGSGGYSAPTRTFAALSHNSDGTWTYVRRARQTFTFSSGGQLTSLADLNGETVTLSYSAGGQLSGVADGAGRELTVAFNGAGHISSVTDPAGAVTTYVYDSAGRLTSTTWPGGAVESYGYDGSNLLTTVTDPRGDVTTNTYDTVQRLTSQVDAAHGTRTFVYGTDGSTTITSPGGRVTVDRYSNGLLASKTVASGTSVAATSTFGYDAATLALTSVTNAANQTTTYTVDARGNRLSATDPLGHTQSWTYDALNDVTSATDPNGHTTTYTYDSRGNLLTASTPLTSSQNQVTTNTYGNSAHPGDLTSVADPTGHVTTFTFDQYGYPATTRDALGDTTTLVHDVLGRVTRSTTPNGASSTDTYTPAGNLASVTDALGHTATASYDSNGNVTHVTDPSGNTTTTVYDALNRPTQVTNPDGTTTSTTYDADGLVTSATDANQHVTQYTYDAQGRPTSTTDPAQRTTSYTFDQAGNLATQTDAAGRTTTYGYDAAHRRTSITYQDGLTPNVTDAYAANGQRTSMTDGTGTTTYSYDALNRLTDTTTGAGQHTGYGYDLAGRPTSVTYPNGKTATKAYDGAGRLTSVTDWNGHATTFTPDADGNTVTTTYGNGVKAAQTFNAADDLTSNTVTSPSGSALAAMTYTRDANNRLASTAETGLLAANETYGYTSRSQLHTINQQTYGYDSAGNPTTLPTSTQAYDNADQLTSTTSTGSGGSTTSYTYDPDGNRVAVTPASGNPTALQYDQDNRLLSVENASLYHPLTPARLADTRTGSGQPYAGQTLSASSSLAIQATGVGGIPTSGVSAVVLNLTAASVTASTILIAYPTGSPRPSTSNVNATPGVVANNEVTLPIGTGGQVSIYNSAGSSNVIVDVLGYYTTSGGGLHALTPVRAVDTRSGSGQPYAGQTIAASGSLTVQIAGNSGVPTTAVGATLQVTAVSPGASGYLITYPAGSTRPNTSSLNYSTGVSLTKEFTATLGTSPAGAITIYNSSTSSLNVIIDVTGYIGSGGDTLTPLTPARIADTRTGSGQPLAGQTLAANTAVTIQVAGHGGVPLNAHAAVLNVTAVPSSGSGYLIAYPGGSRPNTTSLTYNTGTTAFNQVTTKLSATGTVTIYNVGGATDVVVDVMGAFGPLATYTYNGDGMRAAKAGASSSQTYTWDITNANPLLLSDGTTSYLYDNAGNPIEHIDGTGTALYYQHDQYGSTRLLTNASGATSATFTYTAAGQLTSRTGTGDTPLRWNGQYLDTETGNYYLRNRYYDPNTSQFLTADPLRAATGSTYAYANDNALNNSDPSGLCPQCAVFAVGALIGGGMDLGAQVLGNAARGCPYFSNINWGSVGVSALAGGLSEFGGEAFLGARAAEEGAGVAGRDVARSCLNSFTGDTPVTMADGTQKAISKVKIGDKVLATDPETGQTKAEPVDALIRHSGQHRMVLITLADGSVLDSTDGHPVWDATTGQFTEASRLRAGDEIETAGGGLITITGITAYSADITAYNLQINQIHTYYAGATPVLVHNSCDDYIADKIAQHAEHDIPGVADADLPDYVRGVMQRSPGQALRDGRTGWWDPDNGAVVIREGTGGTVFVPKSGYDYFLRQLAE